MERMSPARDGWIVGQGPALFCARWSVRMSRTSARWNTCSGRLVPVRMRTAPKKTTRAVMELLHLAGRGATPYSAMVRACATVTRRGRAGNEFVYQQLASQNADTLQEAQADQDHRDVRTPPECIEERAVRNSASTAEVVPSHSAAQTGWYATVG